MDLSNVNALKRDAGAMAERLGWTVGQKQLARPGRPIRRFETWAALWFFLKRVIEDIDQARARRAAEDASRAPPNAPRGRIIGGPYRPG